MNLNMLPEAWHPPIALALISPTSVCDAGWKLLWHDATDTDP